MSSFHLINYFTSKRLILINLKNDSVFVKTPTAIFKGIQVLIFALQNSVQGNLFLGIVVLFLLFLE